MAEFEFNVECECLGHGELETFWADYGARILYVKPCEDCLEEAREEAREEIRKELSE